MLVGSWTKPNRMIGFSDCLGWGKQFCKISFQVRTPATRNPETHEKHTKEPSGEFLAAKAGRICLSKERNKYNNGAHARHTKMSK